MDPQQQASRDQFDRQSHNYGAKHILAKTEDVEGLLTLLPADAPAGRRALDVATGAGHAAACLARHGWQVTAADIAPAMLVRAEETAAAAGVTLQGTRLHPAEVLPYPDASFELVSCRVAAHHFTDPPAFVREVARVLAPGGAFLLIDGSIADGFPVAEDWLHQVEKLRDPSHGRFMSPDKWRRMCSAAGLSVRALELRPFKQPDLQWYFDTAGTSPQNREAVLRLVGEAPPQARELFGLGEEDGKIVWHWQRLELLACKD